MLTRKKDGKFDKQLTAFGETRSIAHWAEITGLNPLVILARVRVGNMQPEEILTTKHAKRNAFNDEWYAFGEWHTISEWARIKNMQYGTLKYRLVVLGVPIEDALTKKTKGRT